MIFSEASSALARAGLGVDVWRQLIPDDALIAEAESHLLNPSFDVGQASPEMIVGYSSPVRVLRASVPGSGGDSVRRWVWWCGVARVVIGPVG